tara:strand:+ start:1090 stop:1518 length:429 start_codon:yes stop_codon:yes gene_type:complete
MNLIFQAFIAYLGLVPPFYAIIDLFFIEDIRVSMILDFMILYTLIIFTFVGAINWKITKDGSILMTIYGAIPSLLSFLIILAVLNDFEYLLISSSLIAFLFVQLLFDYIIYLQKLRPAFFVYSIRLPVTILLSLLVHLPIYF